MKESVRRLEKFNSGILQTCINTLERSGVSINVSVPSARLETAKQLTTAFGAELADLVFSILMD
jgi:hypothetical protein